MSFVAGWVSEWISSNLFGVQTTLKTSAHSKNLLLKKEIEFNSPILKQRFTNQGNPQHPLVLYDLVQEEMQ